MLGARSAGRFPNASSGLAIPAARAYPRPTHSRTEESMAMGNEIDNVKKATAILITCVVDAMGDLDVGFKDRFVKNLDRS
jgi:hypothetical protein